MKPLAYLPALLLLAACAPQENTAPASAPAAAPTVAASQPAASAASTAAQPDAQWVGRYYGVLPCASCEGIETTLILQEDGSYLLTETAPAVYRKNRWPIHLAQAARNIPARQSRRRAALPNRQRPDLGAGCRRQTSGRRTGQPLHPEADRQSALTRKEIRPWIGQTISGSLYACPRIRKAT